MKLVSLYLSEHGLDETLLVMTTTGTGMLRTDRGIIRGKSFYSSDLNYFEESEEFHKSDIQPYFKRLLFGLIEDQKSKKEGN